MVVEGDAQAGGAASGDVRPTVVLLVRHTEVHNPDKVLYGRLPRFRLSDKGIEQAKKTAEAVAREPVSRIFTSPMLRARQTARFLAERLPDVPIRESWLLAEIGSSWQGTALDSFEPDFTVYEHPREPRDELERHVAARMLRFLRMARRRFPGETIVGVSHGDPIKFAILCAQGWPATGVTARQADPARGSISRFEFDADGAPPRISYVEPDTGRLLVEGWERLPEDVADLSAGAMREVRVGGRELLVARVDEGTVVVTAARCPHMRAHLVDGGLDGEVLTCALHGAQFNLRSGATVREAQCSELARRYGSSDHELHAIETGGLRRYRVREEADGVVWVRTGW